MAASPLGLIAFGLSAFGLIAFGLIAFGLSALGLSALGLIAFSPTSELACDPTSSPSSAERVQPVSSHSVTSAPPSAPARVLFRPTTPGAKRTPWQPSSSMIVPFLLDPAIPHHAR